MEEPKAKAKSKRISKPAIDFVTPHPLEECVRLLAQQTGQVSNWPVPGKFTRKQLSIRLNGIDEDTYEFEARWEDQDDPSHPYVTANGYLKRWEQTSTYVIGTAEFPSMSGDSVIIGIAIFITFLILGTMALVFGVGFLAVFALFGILASGSYVFGMVSLLITLVSAIENSLHRVPDSTETHPV